MRNMKLSLLQTVLSILCVFMSAEAYADHKVKVSPSDELIVIDPNQDSRNRPTPSFVPDANGNNRIEIPPTVIVHRYYYSGDREFQGPMLPGGPTVLVANHPSTGEQVSVTAQMMPGAPRIRYCKSCIIYNYADRCMKLDFGIGGICEPHMVYQRHDPVTLCVKQKAAEIRETTHGFVVATGLPQATAEIHKRSQNAILATGQRINTTGNAVFGRALNLFDSTPTADLAKPSTRRNAQSFLNTERAGITQELDDTIGTNR